MADFRPKYHQIRHILLSYEKNGKFFDHIFYIDDHKPNIELVDHHLQNITSLLFGKDINNLSELIDIITEN